MGANPLYLTLVRLFKINLDMKKQLTQFMSHKLWVITYGCINITNITNTFFAGNTAIYFWLMHKKGPCKKHCLFWNRAFPNRRYSEKDDFFFKKYCLYFGGECGSQWASATNIAKNEGGFNYKYGNTELCLIVTAR